MLIFQEFCEIIVKYSHYFKNVYKHIKLCQKQSNNTQNLLLYFLIIFYCILLLSMSLSYLLLMYLYVESNLQIH